MITATLYLARRPDLEGEKRSASGLLLQAVGEVDAKPVSAIEAAIIARVDFDVTGHIFRDYDPPPVLGAPQAARAMLRAALADAQSTGVLLSVRAAELVIERWDPDSQLPFYPTLAELLAAGVRVVTYLEPFDSAVPAWRSALAGMTPTTLPR